MEQEKFSQSGDSRQRNLILLIMITILITYIAVPLYGVIRDANQGEAIFKIEDTITGTATGTDILNKIVDFIFGSNEITVPASHSIDVEGVLVCDDETPYTAGIVELRSTPRYTRPDENGYFIFRSVETGQHSIRVLDDAGNLVARCIINISIGKNTGGPGIVHVSGDTYTIRVSANVMVLGIKLTLLTDGNGTVRGIRGLELVKEKTQSEVRPEDPGNQNRPNPEEPDSPGETPEQPVPGGGGGGGAPAPASFRFGVYDSGSSTSFGRTAAVQVNIFGTEKRIAPGMKGSYRFTVDNTQNSFRSLYTVDFTERDTLPTGSEIPMRFRLKAGNTYVAGDANTWCTADRLYQDTVIAGNSSLVYTLEWLWPEGENDNFYAELSRNTEHSYTLRIKVAAQQE